jgi:hypothetical protein
MVWLVVSGPALVVLACMVTAGFMVRYPETALPNLTSTPATLSADDAAEGSQPALQARNHAATHGR